MSMSKPSLPVFHPDHPHNRHPQAFISGTSTLTSAPSIYGSTSASAAPTPLGPGFTRANIPQPLRAQLAASKVSWTGSSQNLFPPTPKQQTRSAGGGSSGNENTMSDSDLSSPDTPRRCYCGRPVDIDSGMYCSVACARSDAFSSLCYKPGQIATPPITHTRNQPSLASSIASTLSRDPSSSSADADVELDDSSAGLRLTVEAGSETPEVPGDLDMEADWNGSHYRRLARADMRREERKEERRRRRRADGTSSVSSSSRGTVMSTTSSIASSRVPDLVGGHGADSYNYHSRNPSVASSVTSMSSSNWSSIGGLSRNPSTASSSSRRGAGGATMGTNMPGVGAINVDAVIMEDEDESEYLHDHDQDVEHDTMDRPYFPTSLRSGGARHYPYPATVARRAKAEEAAAAKRQKMGDFGMGRDMRDVLEEIISMEKEFLIDDEDEGQDLMHKPSHQAASLNVNSELLSTPSRHRLTQRPPRTPSPIADKKNSVIPAAPTGPGRRPSLGSGMAGASRPASLLGLHQSSLSESHTALYLATASPVRSASASGTTSASSSSNSLASTASSSRPRRSASPTLQARQSISFTPQAGPALPILRARMDSPAMPGGNSSVSTPVRRRNITPNAHHPAMDHWRFPTSSSSTSLSSAGQQVVDMATTPTPAAQSMDVFPNTAGQLQAQQQQVPASGLGFNRAEATASVIMTAPHLLWPPPPNLAPSLFPSTPGMTGTPEFVPFARNLATLPLSSSNPDLAAATAETTDATVSTAEPTSLSPPLGGTRATIAPPNSGLRLGVLLGSGDVEMEMEVDEEDEDDDGTMDGHAAGVQPVKRGNATYLPVFLEAEGFSARRWA